MAAPWRMAVAVLSFNATPSSWRGSFVVAVCGGAIRMAPWRSWRRHGGNLLFWGLFFGLFVWAIFWGLFWGIDCAAALLLPHTPSKKKKTARFLVFFLCLVQRRRLRPTPATSSTSSNSGDFVQRLRLRPIFHGRQNKGDTGKMSASDPNSAIYVTDSAKDIKNKVNRYAFSGGQDSIENHRKLGANLEVDIPVKYLGFFLDDDAELEHIRTEYGAGRMLTGEVKKRLIEVLTEIVERHRRARGAVTDEMVDAFMAVRPLPNMFS